MMTMISETVCDDIIQKVIAREGGVADVGDGAGETRWGQTPGWLEEFGLPSPKTPQEAARNYRTWLGRTRLDELTGIHPDLADAVIDYAVNAGTGRAVRALQQAVAVAQDGALGVVTLNSVSHADPMRVTFRVLVSRLKFYLQLAKDNPVRNLQYLTGWTNRVLDQLGSLYGITID